MNDVLGLVSFYFLIYIIDQVFMKYGLIVGSFHQNIKTVKRLELSQSELCLHLAIGKVCMRHYVLS